MGDDLDSTIISFTAIQTLFTCFVFSAIAYAKFHSQAYLFLKNQQGVRQTEQMQDVLQEIEDGVIILEEEDNEDDAFNAVEFANSFMKRLFKSNFKADSPESIKKIKQISKEPIEVKSADQILNLKDIEVFDSTGTTSLQKLIFAAKETTRRKKDSFLMIKGPSVEEEEKQDNSRDSSRNGLQRRGSLEEEQVPMFIVQTSMRRLVFNDKECRILILKNLTSAFSYKKANEMGQKMKMLTTTVSHEMRLPLESVLTMCKILLFWTSDKQIIEVVKSIESANKIILCRVGDLLDLSTLDKGSFNPNLKVFNLSQAVDEIVFINSQQALFRDIRVTVLSQSQVPQFVRTDHGRMQQILMNYMGNAIKFTSKGTIEVLIAIKRDRTMPNIALLKIEVRDSGCGISESDQKKLFTPFTMLSANKELNPNGTGMGLSICKRISEKMGGSTWIKSYEDLGSTFGFSFKCEIPDNKQIKAAGFGQESIEASVSSQQLPQNIQEIVTGYMPQNVATQKAA